MHHGREERVSVVKLDGLPLGFQQRGGSAIGPTLDTFLRYWLNLRHCPGRTTLVLVHLIRESIHGGGIQDPLRNQRIQSKLPGSDGLKENILFDVPGHGWLDDGHRRLIIWKVIRAPAFLLGAFGSPRSSESRSPSCHRFRKPK